MEIIKKWNDSDKAFLCRCKCGIEKIIYHPKKISSRVCKECSLKKSEDYWKDLEKIKESLIDIKQNAALSLRKIADKINIEVSSLYGYFKYKHKPRYKNKQKLIDFLTHYKIESKKEIFKSNEQDFIALYFRNKEKE